MLTGCDLTSGGDEEISAEELLTAVVQTVEAALSLTPQATNTNTATATATATATFTPSPSLTSSPTIQVIDSGGGDTGGQVGCDNSTFVTDVTVPDGTQFAPGTVFTKTWQLKNSGSCAWTSAYGLVFTSNAQMSGNSPHLFGHLDTSATTTIDPGATMDVTIELTAPAAPGTYTGWWKMINANGVAFGDPFYVQIVVTGEATTATMTMTPTVTATGPTSTPGSGKPDLRVFSISFDPLPDRTNNFTVRVSVENIGDTDAGAFVVEWWSDQTNDDANTKTAWNVGSLAAGASKTLEYTCNKSSGTCTAYDNSGTYTTKALADASGTIEELDENNNAMTSQVTVK